jgi:hypothetical protein
VLSKKRSYDHAIREFIDWYCSEPRLADTLHPPYTCREIWAEQSAVGRFIRQPTSHRRTYDGPQRGCAIRQEAGWNKFSSC